MLFCVANDAPAFLQFTFDRSVYTGFVPLFGYASLFCFGVLYVRAVLLWPEDDGLFIVFAAFVLCSLWLLCEVEPMYLEFNLTLILLGAGVRRGVLDGGDCDKGSGD